VRIDQSAPAARRGTPAALTKLAALVAAPIARHPVNELLPGAWGRRHQTRLADALYVELAVTRGLPLVTTDRCLRDVPAADIVHM